MANFVSIIVGPMPSTKRTSILFHVLMKLWAAYIPRPTFVILTSGPDIDKILMHPSDKEKTFFLTPDGLFEINVMNFGLCNAPGTFDRFIATILPMLKWETCMCYLGDTILSGRIFDEHYHRLGLVLDRIEGRGLALNSNICHFGEHQTLILGFLVDRDGIRPEPQKIVAGRDFGAPRSLKNLIRFLGIY